MSDIPAPKKTISAQQLARAENDGYTLKKRDLYRMTQKMNEICIAPTREYFCEESRKIG
jgi:hypothetical protein